eukprot:jgi/Botrbrau1/15653/Bobra.4_1s0037.1
MGMPEYQTSDDDDDDDDDVAAARGPDFVAPPMPPAPGRKEPVQARPAGEVAEPPTTAAETQQPPPLGGKGSAGSVPGSAPAGAAGPAGKGICTAEIEPAGTQPVLRNTKAEPKNGVLQEDGAGGASSSLPQRTSTPSPPPPPQKDSFSGETGEEEAPEAMVAVLAEGLVLGRGVLGPTHHSSTTCSDHCFGWPTLDYQVVDSAPFVYPGNYAVLLFGRRSGLDGSAYSQMHVAASSLNGILNVHNYSALLGFTQGNLTEMSSFREAHHPGPPPPPPRTDFDSNFQFGVPPGDVPMFCLTTSIDSVFVLMEADPRSWQSGHVKSAFGYPEDGKMLPFMRVMGQKLGVDLGTLRDSGSVYLRITADAIDADDLRLAYGKIMSEMEIESSGVERDTPTPSTPPNQPLVGHTVSQPEAHDFPPRMSLFSDAVTQTPQSRRERVRPLHNRAGNGLNRQPGGLRRQGSAGLVLRHLSFDRSNAPPDPLGDQRSLTPQGSTVSVGIHGSVDVEDVDEGYVPVILIDRVPELASAFPKGFPIVHLGQAPYTIPTKEAANLDPASQEQGPTVLEVTVGVMKDGTMAVEVGLANTLLQWPFLSDTTLVDAIVSVFLPGPALLEEAGGGSLLTQPAQLLPWLYFNLYLTDSEFFLPVFDTNLLGHSIAHYFGGKAAALACTSGWRICFCWLSPSAWTNPSQG